jgi:hypothetical protein
VRDDVVAVAVAGFVDVADAPELDLPLVDIVAVFDVRPRESSPGSACVPLSSIGLTWAGLDWAGLDVGEAWLACIATTPTIGAAATALSVRAARLRRMTVSFGSSCGTPFVALHECGLPSDEGASTTTGSG